MKKLIVLAALPLLLANGDAMLITPGKWQTTVEVLSIEGAGVPPAVIAAMKGRANTITYCVTPADAKLGPRGAIGKTGNCRMTNYSAAGGKIAVTTTCQQPGGTMTAVSSGSYSPTGFTMVGQSTMTGRMAMKLRSRSVGKRIGAC